MKGVFQCWRCGQMLKDLILPVSRREECMHCHADQHVCKMCVNFDHNHCREDRAEPPVDSEKANFCDYFSPSDHAYQGGYVDKAAQAKAQLAALFGDTEQTHSNSDAKDTLSPAELAEQKLRKLLGGE